jgi:hypothetical protein
MQKTKTNSLRLFMAALRDKVIEGRNEKLIHSYLFNPKQRKEDQKVTKIIWFPFNN